jgi:hypothetical protein
MRGFLFVWKGTTRAIRTKRPWTATANLLVLLEVDRSVFTVCAREFGGVPQAALIAHFVPSQVEIPVAAKELWQLDPHYVQITAGLLSDSAEYRRRITPALLAGTGTNTNVRLFLVPRRADSRVTHRGAGHQQTPVHEESS